MIKLTDLRSKQCVVFSNHSSADGVADESDKPCLWPVQLPRLTTTQPRSWPN